MDTTEIKKILTTSYENHCLKYKSFFEKNGYTVNCSEEDKDGTKLYTLSASKKIDKKDEHFEDKIDAAILKKDNKVSIKTYKRNKHEQKKDDTWDKFEKSLQKDIDDLKNPKKPEKEEPFKTTFDADIEPEKSKQKHELDDDCDDFEKMINEEAEIFTDNDVDDEKMFDFLDKDMYKMDKDIDDKFEDVMNDDYTVERDENKFKMEDNMLKMKHTVKKSTFSQEETERFIKITKHLYKNITKVWNIANKLGRNIKQLGNKNKILCMEKKMYKVRYEKLCLKIKALMRDREYYKDVKQRYKQYREEYVRQKESSDKKDDHIVKLEEELKNIKEAMKMKNKECEEEIKKYMKQVNELKENMGNYDEKIKKMMEESNKTKQHIDNSTKLVNAIISETDCEEMIGGAEMDKRYQSLMRVQPYLPKEYEQLINQYHNQWSSLYTDMVNFDKILNQVDMDKCKSFEITIPEGFIENGTVNYYLLFLYQLDKMKVIPDENCRAVVKMLKIPSKYKTCKKLKEYFKKDIKKLKKMLKA